MHRGKQVLVSQRRSSCGERGMTVTTPGCPSLHWGQHPVASPGLPCPVAQTQLAPVV